MQSAEGSPPGLDLQAAVSRQRLVSFLWQLQLQGAARQLSDPGIPNDLLLCALPLYKRTVERLNEWSMWATRIFGKVEYGQGVADWLALPSVRILPTQESVSRGNCLAGVASWRYPVARREAGGLRWVGSALMRGHYRIVERHGQLTGGK